MKFSGNVWSDRLNELSELKDGWYWENDGMAVHDHTLVQTNVILHLVNKVKYPLPGVFPAIDEGYGISLEWNNFPQKQTLHLQITNDLVYEAYLIDLAHPPTHPDSYLELTSTSISETFQFITGILQKIDFIPREHKYGKVD